jgi:hypothetical protein
MKDYLHPAYIFVAIAFLAGCGRNGDVPRYELSGTLAYNGKAVPAGYITFTPDASKGNQGPATSVSVFNGRFRTPPGTGTIGGPHIATLSGSDSCEAVPNGPIATPKGQPLFKNVAVKIDLPREDSSYDFKLPF